MSTTTILTEIGQERLRQITEEGWTPEHDDGHTEGELADAASCYAFHAASGDELRALPREESVSGLWPWDVDWWKPTTPRHDLIKAAALIVAEIERRDRAEARG